MLTLETQLIVLRLANQRLPVQSKLANVTTIMTSILNANGYPMVSATSVYKILRDNHVHANHLQRDYLGLSNQLRYLEGQVASDPGSEPNVADSAPNKGQGTGYRSESTRTTKGGATFKVKAHYMTRRQRIGNRFKSILKWFMSLFSKQEVKQTKEIRYEINQTVIDAVEEIEDIWYDLLETERVIGKAHTRLAKLIEAIDTTDKS